MPDRLWRGPAEQLAVCFPEMALAPIAALHVRGSGEIVGDDLKMWCLNSDRFGVRRVRLRRSKQGYTSSNPAARIPAAFAHGFARRIGLAPALRPGEPFATHHRVSL